ncbi:hypothetical protein GW17_00002817 [Ensete ventricosum]|nr:hypothetical protein GW17_00002817 [Ensete ventricosum]
MSSSVTWPSAPPGFTTAKGYATLVLALLFLHCLLSRPNTSTGVTTFCLQKRRNRGHAKRAEHIAILNTIIQVLLHEEDLGALVSSSSSSHLPGTKKPRVSACTGRSTPPLRFASNRSMPETIPETP